MDAKQTVLANAADALHRDLAVVRNVIQMERENVRIKICKSVVVLCLIPRYCNSIDDYCSVSVSKCEVRKRSVWGFVSFLRLFCIL